MAEKKYLIDNAKLMAEWDWDKNTDLDPNALTLGSGKKAWWKCNKGHEWQAMIVHRNNGVGCPYCAGQKVLKGYNDLQTINPILAEEWYYEKNNNLRPTDVTPNSNKKVWWKCSKGHEWQATIANRNNGHGCPHCAVLKVSKGYNDLQTINPSLAKEWNYEKNGELTPMDVTATSNKKVWWKCAEEHEWQSTIANRHNGHGCPYCAKQKILKGYNDLQTVNPTLAKEWNYEKNGELIPTEVTATSNKKVWWKCSKGHEWQATIGSRNKGHGCPYCSGQKAIKGYNDLQTINPHLSKEWNYEKNNGLTPADVLPNSMKKVWWKCNKEHEWQATIASRNNGVGCPICSSERRTSFPEYAIEYYLKKYGLDVIHLYREKGYELDVFIPSKKIAIEYDGYFWHKNKSKKDIEKNRKCEKDGITLYRIREGLPSLNDSSLDFIVQTTQKDLSIVLKKVLGEIIGCTVDIDIERDSIDIENLREYMEKENSLLFSNPQIAKEWNYEKNGKLRPEHFASNSGKKVWWKCAEGHEWQAAIANRNNGSGCPYCSGRYIVQGKNDLETINPVLSKEWNYGKNGNLTPTDVMPYSSLKVWWKCSKGHEWEASISTRNNGTGCPYCAGKKLLIGVNDLQTVNPDLAKEWNYAKNNGLTPADVMPNSNKKAWWKCTKGHEWQAIIQSRNNGSGCPYCAGKNFLRRVNNLQTANPDLAKEWNYEKNNGLTPADIMPNSNKKAWWKCTKGHEWQAIIQSRNNGSGCPYCAGKKILNGFNDLQSINPDLAKEWNYERNGELTPTDVTANSGKKVWWKCAKGHEWQATIINRNRGSRCPVCRKEKSSKS